MNEITISTDGSHLKGNFGGWSALISSPDDHYERTALFGNEVDTTINRMELSAVIEALRILPNPALVTVRSDSMYVVNAIRKGWVHNWASNNWIKSDGNYVANIDLWKELLHYLNLHTVNAVHVKGHNGDEENEICDSIAKSCAYDRRNKQKIW